MKKTVVLALSLCLAWTFTSCNVNDEPQNTDPQTQSKLSATASGSSSGSAENARIIVSGFAVNQLTVGTQNVEMKYYAKADLLAGINLGNLQLKSNVSTGLQTSSSSQKSTVLIASGESRLAVIGEGGTPEGNYREVSFQLFKNTSANSNDPMHQKSLLITGEINGKLTTIWTERESTLRAVSESSTGVEVDGNSELVLNFDLRKLFEGVNFATALDANGDGRIEIGPNSPDGNAAIFSRIESNLSTSVILQKR
uniref:hypothetical protein n=1 Tax=Algoriphagus sp. TaxID=1872435 RepID=UPI00258C40C8|nr:hypothetical protein [Algoriphagus sp.]